MFTLSQVEPGKRVKIVSLVGGRGLHGRLVNMGMIPGSTIEVVGQGMNGPRIVTHNGCRLAIGRGVARKIIVSDLS